MINYPKYIDAVQSLVGTTKGIGGKSDGPIEKIYFPEGVTPPTEEAIQTKLAELQNAEPMRLLRQERDKKLTETDWRATVDYPGSDQDEWKTYRQALRDLPSTYQCYLANKT